MEKEKGGRATMKKNQTKKKAEKETKEQPIKQGRVIDTLFRITPYIVVGIFLAAGIASAIIIITKSWGIEKESVVIAMLYIMGTGWLLFLPCLPVVIIARKEILNKLKVFGRRSRVAVIRMILGDSNEHEQIVKLAGNTIEIGEGKYIINPRKATIKDGVKVLTYVGDNSLAHDYFDDPNKTIKDIAKKISGTKQESLHDVFSDPIRVDAKYFNETFLAAQQTNPDILKKIIAFLTSKNVLVILGFIALLAGAAALFGLQANNMLNSVPLCQTGTIVT